MSLWSSAFETGNELVDNDHKAIFMLVEQVLSSSFLSGKDKVEVAVEFLAEYVVGHFANEERLMDESNYPNSEQHKKEHADFLAVAVDIKEKFANGDYTLGENDEDDAQHFSCEINNTVVGWLKTHVLGSDMDLAAHYRNFIAN